MEIEQQYILAGDLVDEGIAAIDRRYGPNGETPLGYHNPNHSRSMHAAGLAMCELAVMWGNFDPALVPAARVAFGWHDSVQLRGSGVNEAESIYEMHEAVRRKGRRGLTLSDRSAERAGQYMAATVVELDEKGVLRQSPIGDDYGELITADADLSSLGAPSDVYWPQVQGLFMELKGPNANRETQIQFLANSQIPLLQCHEFYTLEAQRLFPYQGRNLAIMVAALELLQKGDERYDNLFYKPLEEVRVLFDSVG